MKRLTVILAVLLAASIAHADYLGSWAIDDYVPIPVATHRFSTGNAYQPTTLTYSIYEDGSTTGIDEDVDMTPASPFDSKTGLYLARRQLTAAAGFEAGKNYTIRIYAVVDSVTANIWHTFQIEAETKDSSYDTNAEYAEAIWGAAVASYSDEADFGGELGGLDANLALVLADTSAQDEAAEWTTLMGGYALNDVNDVLKRVADDILTDTATIDTPGEFRTLVWSAAAASYDVEDSFGNIFNDLFTEDSGTGIYYIATIDEDYTTLDLDGTTISASLDASSVDAIWDEVMSGHTTVGSAAVYLRGAAAERRQ